VAIKTNRNAVGYISNRNLASTGFCKRKDCAYFASSTKSCDYRLVHGIGRGCPVEGCKRYEKGKKKKALDRDWKSNNDG